jgi:hypothetical protein
MRSSPSMKFVVPCGLPICFQSGESSIVGCFTDERGKIRHAIERRSHIFVFCEIEEVSPTGFPSLAPLRSARRE